MPGLRASRVSRNIHFVNAENNEIGGAWQNGTLTWAEMAEWMQITYLLPLSDYAPHICLEDGDPRDPITRHGNAIIVDKNTNRIQPGFYILLSPSGTTIDIPINPEDVMIRSLSRSSSNPDPRTESFCRRVRARDGQCVISHRKPFGGRRDFTGLDAVHIFPLAQLDRWRSEFWQRHITDDVYDGPTGLHSVQNGILLDAGLHALFDSYFFAINPDNEYKVHVFGSHPADGAIMFRGVYVPDMYQASRALLKAHFRMAVLHNMKDRAGVPCWDEDIPGGDEIAEMAESEDGKLWLETALAGRLNALLA